MPRATQGQWWQIYMYVTVMCETELGYILLVKDQGAQCGSNKKL